MNFKRPVAVLSAMALILAAGNAIAQSGDLPVSPMGDQAPPAGIVSAAAGVDPAAQPAPVVETTKRPPRMKSSAPPSEIQVASGKNTVFSVALFHVNRVVTPFRSPEVRTSSTATLTIENGIVYVTTQTEDPIGLFVFEKSDPSQAISLTLMPAAISPVSVKINLEGWSQENANYGITSNEEKARTWETEDPYVETIKNLFKELAMGKVPEGYGLQPIDGRYRYLPNCNIAGAQVLPLQLIEGASVTAIVARVTNRSYQQIEVNEGACQSTRMIGGAAWPKTSLNPGESTELYLAIKSPDLEDRSSDRPSVIARGGY